MATGILASAHGGYSNMACLSPSATVGWWRFIKSELERALAMERDISGLFCDVVQPMLARDPFRSFALDKALVANRRVPSCCGCWSSLEFLIFGL